jgi:HAD superfamily hydrolase (TIGR01509 family)
VYRAVLLDIDGTLVDSNDAHARAWVQALAEHGRRVEFSRVRPLIGKGGDKLLPELVGLSASSVEGEAISARRSEIFQREHMPRLLPTRGAQRLLEWLRDDNLTLAVATSAKESEVQGLLRIANVTKLIDTASSSDDVDESKPDPDVIHAALKKAGSDSSNTIMIGDTPYDIEAAGRAGLGTIALRCGGWWPDEALAGALAIYDDPEDLLQNYDLSPFKRRVPVFGAQPQT